MDGRLMSGDMEDCIAEFIAAWPRARDGVTSANLLRVGDSLVEIALSNPFANQPKRRRRSPPARPFTGLTLVPSGNATQAA